MNVYGETITSSPTSTSSTCRAVSSAVVPFAVATQRLAPSRAAYFSSNCETMLPLPRYQLPLRRTPRTDSSAALSQTGQRWNGLARTGCAAQNGTLARFLARVGIGGNRPDDYGRERAGRRRGQELSSREAAACP